MKTLKLFGGLFYVATLSLLAMGFSKKEAPTGMMIIEFHDVKPAKGCVSVRLYNSESNFLEKNGSLKESRQKVGNGNILRISYDDLPFGTYAVAAYYDENCNHKLDKNFIGLPSEPYAFSKDFHAKTRKPEFKEVCFPFKSSGQVVKMEF